jgi:hypothetical protein
VLVAFVVVGMITNIMEIKEPIRGAARSVAYACDRLLAGIAGSNSAGGHGCFSLVNVVCCKVQTSARGRSLIQGNSTECVCVIECDQVQQ